MQSMVQPGSQAEQVGRLFLAVVVVYALPALPLGEYIIYPFAILTTWFHEMGHGLAAIAMGQTFKELQIFPNGSGLALNLVRTDISPVASAVIAAGGPLAPIVAGGALIMASAHERAWRPALWALIGAIGVSMLLYVTGIVGLTVLPVVMAILALIAWRAPRSLVRFTLQFVGVIAALSMLRDFNYLYTERGVINGREILSDTGQIEAALFLPHWFWASLILLISALTIGASLKYALSEKRLPRPKPPANVLQFKRRPDD